jgi:hypothetical protein
MNSVHKHLRDVHFEKHNNPFRSGTADVWYSGRKADLWVEYKFVEIPVRGATDLPIDLSARQLNWLRGRLSEGRNVAVIVGCKEGGVLLQNRAWEALFTAASFQPLVRSRQFLADWIRTQTGPSPCLTHPKLFSSPTSRNQSFAS